MKHILVAVALCALPATALAQSVVCQACDHVAPYFRGEGGFIATVAEGVDEVVFVASCGNVTTTGEVGTGGGTVAQLFTYSNGLACDQDDGSLEIGGVEDGGWYWITDAANSAVGSLVGRDVLDNEPTAITNAGPGVSMTLGRGAVFLKESSTGRVGILPNILPEPPTAALRTCGFNDRGTRGTSATSNADQADARFTRRTEECALGDGGTMTLATTTNTFTGATTVVADKALITRPRGTGEVVITIDLWGNGSGHFTTAADGHALLGQSAVAMTSLRGYRLTGVSYRATLGSGPTANDFQDGTALGGITMDTSTTSNAVTFTIAADTAYCSEDNNEPAPVSVTAVINTAGVAAVTPGVARTSTGVAGRTSFTVVCGSASASVH